MDQRPASTTQSFNFSYLPNQRESQPKFDFHRAASDQLSIEAQDVAKGKVEQEKNINDADSHFSDEW